MPIDRRPLREQVRDEVLLLLERGEIAADRAINEGHLAARLGVSRTPLREALITLEHEGVITSHTGKGFRFAPLSRKEFTDLCEILASLEMLALQLSNPAVLEKVAPTLLRRAREFPDNQAPVGTVERRDDEWHDLLLSGCTNDRLMELVTSVKVGLRRYEHPQVGRDTMLQRSAAEHERIAQCLVDGDLAGAVDALKQNWHSGMERILELMEALPAAHPTEGPDASPVQSQRWWRDG